MPLLINIKQVISDELLIQSGAKLRDLKKGELIAAVSEQPEYVNMVSSGCVKICYFNEEGREYIITMIGPGEMFGHASAISNQTYATSSYTTEPSKVWFIKREAFIKLLLDNPQIMFDLLVEQAFMLRRLSDKLSEMAVEDAEYRLSALMNHYKQKRGVAKNQEFVVPLTRQQLADMTGLRVETVIRTIKLMEQKGLLEIIEGKIFWTPKRSVPVPATDTVQELA